MTNPTQLSFVSLQVSDLEASHKFYTEILGFQLAPKSPPDAFVFEQKNGATFAIRKPLVELSQANKLGWGISIWFEISDLDHFLSTHKEALSIVRDAQQTPFGRTIIIADPDGYGITLQEKKS